jgi:hypothetical protein
MLVAFECAKDQIAHNANEIKEDTQVYVGKLVPGIFDKIQKFGIEHVYTSFPEGKICKETIKIGGKDAEKLIEEMQEENIDISEYAMSMLKSKDFAVLEENEDAILIRLKVRDLGISHPTTDNIYKRIKELGLELCPADVGPHLRLQYQNQPMGEWVWIGMKQIFDRDGCQSVFVLIRFESGLWLNVNWSEPTLEWSPEGEIVFRLRKLSAEGGSASGRKPSKT